MASSIQPDKCPMSHILLTYPECTATPTEKGLAVLPTQKDLWVVPMDKYHWHMPRGTGVYRVRKFPELDLMCPPSNIPRDEDPAFLRICLCLIIFCIFILPVLVNASPVAAVLRDRIDGQPRPSITGPAEPAQIPIPVFTTTAYHSAAKPHLAPRAAKKVSAKKKPDPEFPDEEAMDHLWDFLENPGLLVFLGFAVIGAVLAIGWVMANWYYLDWTVDWRRHGKSLLRHIKRFFADRFLPAFTHGYWTSTARMERRKRKVEDTSSEGAQTDPDEQ